MNESRSLNCLRVLNLLTTKGVKNKLAKDRYDHTSSLLVILRLQLIIKGRTSVDSCDGVSKTVKMSDQKMKFYDLFDKYCSENEKKKLKSSPRICMIRF